MEAQTSLPRRLQIVVQNQEKERRNQRMEAAKGKPGRTVFWILKSARAPSVARAPLLIFRREWPQE